MSEQATTPESAMSPEAPDRKDEVQDEPSDDNTSKEESEEEKERKKWNERCKGEDKRYTRKFNALIADCEIEEDYKHVDELRRIWYNAKGHVAETDRLRRKLKVKYVDPKVPTFEKQKEAREIMKGLLEDVILTQLEVMYCLGGARLDYARRKFKNRCEKPLEEDRGSTKAQIAAKIDTLPKELRW